MTENRAAKALSGFGDAILIRVRTEAHHRLGCIMNNSHGDALQADM
jgi:hypothetical protein